jgi:RimJ/RimL family protein N-acetyltransferase
VIETERLVIRPLEPDERPGMLALWLDPANERVDPGTPLERVGDWVERMPSGVWERESGELVGDCGIHFDEGFQEWELSYGFRSDRWGRGYATEAARACVHHGFETLGVAKIVADVVPENKASARVLEKCGFAFVRELEDGRLFYEVTRETYFVALSH